MSEIIYKIIYSCSAGKSSEIAFRLSSGKEVVLSIDDLKEIKDLIKRLEDVFDINKIEIEYAHKLDFISPDTTCSDSVSFEDKKTS